MAETLAFSRYKQRTQSIGNDIHPWPVSKDGFRLQDRSFWMANMAEGDHPAEGTGVSLAHVRRV